MDLNLRLKNIYREVNLKFIVVEIVLFITVIYLIGYFLNKSDPLFFNSKLSFLLHLLPISILTLFYGIFAGLLYFIAFSGSAILIYGKVDYEYLLSLLLFLLIFSEFWFYWDKRIKEAEERFKYADDKLRDTARTLFLTKLSHDMLERFYITKPVSLRKVIFDLKRGILEHGNREEILKKLFLIITSNFSVEKGGIFYVDEDLKLKFIAGNTDIKEPNRKDPLIDSAITSKVLTYISNFTEEKSDYLAVVPILEGDNVKYLLTIEKMPFLNFNMDNLLSINLVADYVILSVEDLVNVKDIYKKFKEFDIDFIKELNRMFTLNKKFGIDSTVIYIYVKGLNETIYDLIISNIRGLDMAIKLDFKAKNFQGIALLLPFTDIYGANLFIKRIKNILIERYSAEYPEKNVKYKLYKINEPERLFLEFYTFEGF
ncbi:MAG: PelD GGDEF domain-containing protein [Hydrogenothermaceae bacterium]